MATTSSTSPRCSASRATSRAPSSLFEQAVDTSFYPHQFFAVYCPFLGPLRGTPEFERILAKAERRVREFSA